MVSANLLDKLLSVAVVSTIMVVGTLMVITVYLREILDELRKRSARADQREVHPQTFEEDAEVHPHG